MDDPGQESGTRKVRVTTAGWTAGISAFVMCCTLGTEPEWPVAVGVVAVAAMVAVACYFILEQLKVESSIFRYRVYEYRIGRETDVGY